jgi:hypothetical protein
VFGERHPGGRDHEPAYLVRSLYLQDIRVVIGQDRDIDAIGFAEVSRGMLFHHRSDWGKRYDETSVIPDNVL